MAYDLKRDCEIDQAATDGYKAAAEGKSLPPSKYLTDDVLMCAWTIGNKRGLAETKPVI